MNCEIISVGTELLLGDTVDTNSSYISKKLAQFGISVFYHKTVGDNRERLKNVIKNAVNNNDLVIVTGGLGPTEDDITRETAAEVMELPLVSDNATVERLKFFFEKRGIPLPPSNLKQAMVPENSIVLTNKNGTAPGSIIEKNDKIIVLLPGPPHEMKALFEDQIQPFLEKKSGVTIFSRVVRFAGIGESAMEAKVVDLIRDLDNPTVAPYAKPGECILRITARAKNKKESEDLIYPVLKKIQDRLGEYIYGYDEDTLSTRLLQLLIEKGLKLSTAESCTAGLIASMIVDAPGSSSVFSGGIIAYSNEVKMRDLGVQKETLDIHGAVSEETVREMAVGACRKFETDTAISVSGVAGPGGGTMEKPVGLVYGAISIKKDVFVYKMQLGGSREHIRYRASRMMLYYLIKKLELQRNSEYSIE